MRTFRLKLKVTDSSTKSWQVFLETENINDQVLQWTDEGGGEFSKTIDPFKINDEKLNVFVACNGIGSKATCAVTINGKSVGSVTARFNDSTIATKAFDIPAI